MMESYVRLEGVVKRFGETIAVNNVYLDIPKGSFTTLLGPSGCGKTTTLRMIAGFYDVDEGRIYIGDRMVNQIPPHLRNIGMVFQDYALFPHMTVFENVSYGLRIRRESRDRLAQKVREMLDFVGLSGLDKRYPNQLSGGQQQRVALARALATGPDVLLLDEPLSNLDAKLRVSVRRELREVQRRLGITVIYVTHDQDEALELSDSIAVMNKGIVVQVGTPWEIYFQPRSRFVADFVGAVNFLAGTVTRRLGTIAEVASEAGLILARDPDGIAQPGGKALVAFRPECVEISTQQDNGEGTTASGDSDLVTVFRGKIRSRSFLGRMVRYWIEVPGREIMADVSDPGSRGILEGEVNVKIKNDKVRIVSEG
ncbi:MAG TPA: ABC transporter ATP-binding protein [Firmicutes bacterium]|nr:ABC transporter ATP-binding protein [Bacillota bacterium]